MLEGNLEDSPQAKPRPNRAVRLAVLVTAVTAVLGAGGASVAYAVSDGDQPIETGFVVSSTTATDRECEEWKSRTPGPTPSQTPSDSPSDSPSETPPQTPPQTPSDSAADAQVQL